jgi:ribosomal protein S6--L-glutamate ligase
VNILVLSRDKTLYSTARLVEAAKLRGHDVRVVDYLRCYMNITATNPQVIFGSKALEDVDAIIPRIGASHTFYGTAVVRQFEVMNVVTANGSQPIARSRDKLRSLQILSHEGIGLPVTAFAHSPKDVDGVIEAVGGAPLVIKLLEGTQGIGVVLAENPKAAESVIQAFKGLNANILVQEFIKEADGADIRALVVGKKVVAAMMRKSTDGDFRANLHRGAVSSKVKLSPEERSTALRAARAVGLKVAGVDLLRSNHGPVVLEVNSSPGLEGIEKASGKDIAAAIIELLERERAAKVTGRKVGKRPGRLHA